MNPHALLTNLALTNLAITHWQKYWRASEPRHFSIFPPPALVPGKSLSRMSSCHATACTRLHVYLTLTHCSTSSVLLRRRKMTLGTGGRGFTNRVPRLPSRTAPSSLQSFFCRSLEIRQRRRSNRVVLHFFHPSVFPPVKMSASSSLSSSARRAAASTRRERNI